MAVALYYHRIMSVCFKETPEFCSPTSLNITYQTHLLIPLFLLKYLMYIAHIKIQQ